MTADQVEDTLRVILVFSTLCEEEQALPCLLCVCRVRMSDVLGLLIAQVCGEMLVFQGDIAEPEVFLREDQASEQ